MKFEKTEVFNFEGAIRGMRNPMNSWDKSDSTFNIIGPNDLILAQKLVSAGSEHAKFMRQIFVSVDITAPLYWWKEFDTYKVGTVANSTSTMHKLTSTPITMECFEIDDYDEDLYVPRADKSNNSEDWEDHWHVESIWYHLIEACEDLRQAINAETDPVYKKALWKELIRVLPQSWLQTRTVTLSYANLRNIYFQRQNHKLEEWHKFCDWVDTLPYSKELICWQ